MALCCLLQAASVQQAASGALVDRVLSPELLEEHLQPRAAREELIPLAVVLQGAVGPFPIWHGRHRSCAGGGGGGGGGFVAQEGLSHQSIAAVAVAASCLVEVLPVSWSGRRRFAFRRPVRCVVCWCRRRP